MNIIIYYFSSFIFWSNKTRVIAQDHLLFIIAL